MSERQTRDDKDGDQKRKDMVVLRNVSKVFPMGDRKVKALKEVSMTLPTAAMAVIQGTSGSGKTTLLNIIGAMDRPTSGEVKVASQDLGRLSEAALTEFRSRHVGFVFQFFNLIPSLNAVENVLVPTMFQAEPPVDRALELLEQVGLADRWDHKPSQLSGGERQRLAVARSLINDPSLLLADEPTGNLDHETGKEILRLFTQLVEAGRTVIVVTHDPEVAARGDARYTIRDGALSEWKEE
jgi:ABC-type lipoprotein export system ATPase subunit